MAGAYSAAYRKGFIVVGHVIVDEWDGCGNVSLLVEG
jgi:hypothetical protein